MLIKSYSGYGTVAGVIRFRDLRRFRALEGMLQAGDLADKLELELWGTISKYF